MTVSIYDYHTLVRTAEEAAVVLILFEVADRAGHLEDTILDLMIGLRIFDLYLDSVIYEISNLRLFVFVYDFDLFLFSISD